MRKSMARILTVARLTMRAAVRSRLVLTLVGMLAAAVVGLPLVIHGDGTAVGEMRVLLAYSLGVAVAILSLATVWAACSSVSLEIEDRTIRLVAVKPVQRGEIWVGKWLGLVTLNAVLLLAVGVGVYASAWAQLARHENKDDAEAVRPELLIGRRRLVPRPTLTDEDVHRRLEQLVAAGHIPDGMPEAEACHSLHRAMLTHRSTALAGASQSWTFDVPPATQRALKQAAQEGRHVVTMRVRFVTGWRDEESAPCTWTVAGPDGSETYRQDTEIYPDGLNRVELPAAALAELESFSLTLHNTGTTNPRSLVVEPFNGLQILVRESGFGSNLERGLGVVFCQLALLAALGLACGTAFSLPVAAFTATCVVVLTLIAHYFAFASANVSADCGHNHGDVAEPSLVEEASEHVLAALATAVRPIVDPDPLPRITDGVMVPRAMLGRAILLHLVLLPTVLGLLSTLLFRRRELAGAP